MIMMDILHKVDLIAEKFFYKTIVIEKEVPCQIGEVGAIGTHRMVQTFHSHNIVTGMLAIAESINKVAIELRDLNPKKNQSA